MRILALAIGYPLYWISVALNLILVIAGLLLNAYFWFTGGLTGFLLWVFVGWPVTLILMTIAAAPFTFLSQWLLKVGGHEINS